MMKYFNLDLELFDYKKDANGVEYFRVRVIDSPGGQQRQSDAETVSLIADLRRRLQMLRDRSLPLSERIERGESLANLLFPTQARRLLDQSRAGLMDNEGLRIRLRLDNYALADLPWEYAYIAHPDTPPEQKDSTGFLVLDRKISLVRFELMREQMVDLTPLGSDPIHMVTLMASPHDPGYSTLKLDEEELKIRGVLKKVPQIKAEFFHNATVQTLLDALTNGAHIFHFAGHGQFEGDLGLAFGEAKGSIVLTDKDRKPVLFNAEKLAQNLRGSCVRLAVLGACEAARRDQVNAWTGVAPALTRAGIPAVVGMQFTIQDENAIAFSRQLYRTLAAGQPIDAAVTDGRIAIFNQSGQDERDWGVPVLYLRDDDGILFPASRVLRKQPGPPEREPLEASRYLALRTKHFEQFLGRSLEPGDLKIEGEEHVSKLRFKLLHQRLLKKPRILMLRGTLFPCGLLNSGWWERAGGYKPTRIHWRNPIQAWLFNGFDLWAPSWDFSWNLDSYEETSKKSYFVAQLGSGDEADSLPVVLQYEKAKGLRGDFIDRGGCLEVEVTGLLGRREHFTAKLGASGRELEEKLRFFGGLLDYCLWVSDEEKTHTVQVLRDETEMYSGYLWKCLAPKDWLKDKRRLKLDEVFFVWEHTNFASKEAVKYNLDSLEHKERYIRSIHGDLVLIQKSSSLVPGEPELLSQDIYDLLLRGQCDVVK